MIDALRGFLVAEQWAVLAYFLAVNGFLVMVLFASGLEMRAHLLESWHESRWPAGLRRGAHDHPARPGLTRRVVPDACSSSPIRSRGPRSPTRCGCSGAQRDRWHRGLADVLWRHRHVFGRPRYGNFGLVAFPYFLFVELLAPVVEAVGLLGLAAGLALGAVNLPFAVLFFALAYGLGIVISVFTIALEEWSYRAYGGLRDRLRLAGWSMAEGPGYRQLTTVWRLRGLIKYMRGTIGAS